jgi:hypothetical protein
VHGVAVAFETGKIGQLPDEIGKALTRQSRYRMDRIALRLGAVTACAILVKLRGSAIWMSIE